MLRNYIPALNLFLSQHASAALMFLSHSGNNMLHVIAQINVETFCCV